LAALITVSAAWMTVLPTPTSTLLPTDAAAVTALVCTTSVAVRATRSDAECAALEDALTPVLTPDHALSISSSEFTAPMLSCTTLRFSCAALPSQPSVPSTRLIPCETYLRRAAP
jgi:hypothetical protein